MRKLKKKKSLPLNEVWKVQRIEHLSTGGSKYLNRSCHPSANVGSKEQELHHGSQEHNWEAETHAFPHSYLEGWHVPTLSFCKKTAEEPEKKPFRLHKDLHKPIEDERSTKQSPKLVSCSSNKTVFLHSQLIMEFGGCHKENTIKQLGKNNVILSSWGIYCRAVQPLNLNLALEVFVLTCAFPSWCKDLNFCLPP